MMEAHWVAGELNLRVGSAHIVIRPAWAPCGPFAMGEPYMDSDGSHICFTPTCMVIRKYGTRIGYIIVHIVTYGHLYN